MTLLCIPILLTDPARARRDLALAAEAGADLVELRLDRCIEPAEFVDVVRSSTVPVIATCRPEWEGGQSHLADDQRAKLLRIAAEAGATCVDLELAAARQVPVLRGSNESTPRLILSAHDFRGRPDRLYNLIAEMNAAPCDVNKVAWTARTIRDNLEAFDLLRTRQKPTIALCMGEAGLISRILARKFGGFLTFAALEEGSGTAPGQPTIADLKRLYRWDAIRPSTRVYGVVAQPVMHSMSPAIHNAAFEAIGYDGVYLPLLVEAGYESFKAFMETFLHAEGLHLSGLSVTLPHKENALRYLREKDAEIEPLAQRIGALNTIAITPSPTLTTGNWQLATLRGFNTDYAAILDSITAVMGIRREDLADRRVSVLGAGGAGRTAVAALAHYGASVTIYNRTLARAEELAREFDGHAGRVAAAPLDQLKDAGDILINTTSVGLHPRADETPVPEPQRCISDQAVVFDTIYNPMKTRLLAEAEQLGARTIGGVEMFVRQAAAQFEAWTSHPAPTAIMRSVIERRLSGR